MIQTKQGNFNPINYINMGLVKGRNWLESQGFNQTANKQFYVKDNIYAHYNKCLKYWVVEYN
jgi:hypothetical protein